jgi:hypothetical protein
MDRITPPYGSTDFQVAEQQTRYLLTGYPGTNSERTIEVVVESSPHGGAFGIRVPGETGWLFVHHMPPMQHLTLIAMALLRAASNGNGGFPLDHLLY